METPVLERAAGGAEARPFQTYHNTLGRNFTLRIATGTPTPPPSHHFVMFPGVNAARESSSSWGRS